MKVLVITHAKNHKLNDNLAQLLTAASQIAPECTVLVIGDTDCQQLASYACVNQVIQFADVDNAKSQASYLAPAIASLAKNYSHVLIAADSFGKDLLPRVAGILDVAQVSEVVAIVSPNIFKKPLYAGNVVAELESFEDVKLLTIRATSFAAYAKTGAVAPVEVLTDQATEIPGVRFVSEAIVHTETIDLAQAQIIVSGGRSLGSKEAFDELIHGLALKLEGAVGASRAAVEAGYASNDSQVGQTGKVVAPAIYLAIGISGAVQHIAGMKDSRTVIAVNLDPNAQIFEYADYGLVGDLFEVLPVLLAKL